MSDENTRRKGAMKFRNRHAYHLKHGEGKRREAAHRSKKSDYTRKSDRKLLKDIREGRFETE
jgi:hypothetical protein